MSNEQNDLIPEPAKQPEKKKPSPEPEPQAKQVITAESFVKSLKVPRFAADVITDALRKAVGRQGKQSEYQEAYLAYGTSRDGAVPTKK